MEIEITKPTKKINWKQLKEEIGLEHIPIKTKGNKMWIMDTPQKDINKILTAIETHIPNPQEPRINLSDILAKLNTIEEKLNA